MIKCKICSCHIENNAIIYCIVSSMYMGEGNCKFVDGEEMGFIHKQCLDKIDTNNSVVSRTDILDFMRYDEQDKGSVWEEELHHQQKDSGILGTI